MLAADDVDCVVVVGSERSSNSQRLVQVVREKGHRPAYLVDTAADLDPGGSAAFTVWGSHRAPRRRHRSRAQSSRRWRRCPTPSEVTFRLQGSQTREAC